MMGFVFLTCLLSHVLKINSTLSIFDYYAKQNMLCINVEIHLLVFWGKAVFVCPPDPDA